MPNTFAYLAVFGFPLVAMWIFRRNPVHIAVILSLLVAYLMLPGRVALDLPMLPKLNKDSIAALSAAVLCLAALARQKVLARQGRIGGLRAQDTGDWLPKSALLRVFLALYFIAPVLTVLSNSDGYVVGGRYLSGLRPYDALSALLLSFMTLLPFFLARRFLASTEAHLALLKILVAAMIGYGVLALIEIRLSPQFNNWIYGYFPHSFIQHIRAGGFRPLVFLNHGLLLGLLMSMALLAAVGLWRVLGKKTPGYVMFAIPFLAVVLVLSKTLGALVLAVIFAPIVLFLGRRTQLFVAALVAALVLLYPMLRGADLVPTGRILEVAANIDPVRAHSLDIRFGNEKRLLEHANSRPLLGWGGWGRSRVYDAVTGKDITITDGLWIIEVGLGGWLGYLTRFGLFALPLILLAWRSRSLGLSAVTGVLCIIHAANLVDLLPNAGLTSVTWLATGALWGRYELGREKAGEPAEGQVPEGGGSAYRRQLGPVKERADRQSGPVRDPRGPRRPNGLAARSGS